MKTPEVISSPGWFSAKVEHQYYFKFKLTGCPEMKTIARLGMI